MLLSPLVLPGFKRAQLEGNKRPICVLRELLGLLPPTSGHGSCIYVAQFSSLNVPYIYFIPPNFSTHFKSPSPTFSHLSILNHRRTQIPFIGWLLKKTYKVKYQNVKGPFTVLLLDLCMYWDYILLSQNTLRELKALNPNRKYGSEF